MDILVTSDLKIIVGEVQTGPGMSTTTGLKARLIPQLQYEAFDLLLALRTGRSLEDARGAWLEVPRRMPPQNETESYY